MAANSGEKVIPLLDREKMLEKLRPLTGDLGYAEYMAGHFARLLELGMSMTAQEIATSLIVAMGHYGENNDDADRPSLVRVLPQFAEAVVQNLEDAEEVKNALPQLPKAA